MEIWKLWNILANEKEINLNAKSKRGKTPIVLARERRDKKIISLLESFQMDSNQARFNLRKRLGLAGKDLIDYLLSLFA